MYKCAYVPVRILEPEARIRVLLCTDFRHDTTINNMMYKHNIYVHIFNPFHLNVERQIITKYCQFLIFGL